jgi:glycosyltransferase involved in cell wall biosynthesis
MDVSILICTHNSAKRLPETLHCLKKQITSEDLSWEVLIVDYKSSDDTNEVVQKIWNDFQIPLRIIEEKQAGKTPALETGLRVALGEAVCIIDDDNWIAPDFINIANKIIKQYPDVGVIGAQGIAHCEIEPPDWFVENQGIYAVGHQGDKAGYVENEKRRWFWGAGSVVRKQAWMKAKDKGFKPIFNPSRESAIGKFKKGFSGGEDPEMCFAIQLVGYKLWYEPSLRYQHYIPKNRLQESFISDATSGTSKAAPLLRIYLAELTTKGSLGRFRKLIYQNWIFHNFFLVTRFGQQATSNLFSKDKNWKLNHLRITKEYKSQLDMMWELRSEFSGYVKSIKELKQ